MIKSKFIVLVCILCCCLCCACTSKDNNLNNVTLISNNFTYTGEEILPAFSDLPNGCTYKVFNQNNEESKIVNAGNYTLIVKNKKYSKTFEIVVNKKQVLLTLENKNAVYNGSAIEMVPQLTESINENYSVSVLYNGSEVAPTNSGTYLVTATLESTNYFANAQATLTINKAPCSLEMPTSEFVYTGENIVPQFLSDCTEEHILTTKLLNFENAVNVGSYRIKAQIESLNYFYENTFDFEITPKPIIFSLTQTNFVYNGNEINILSYVNCLEKVEFMLNQNITLINAGTYEISIIPKSTNFVGVLNAEIVISKKTVTLNFMPQTLTYNGNIQNYETNNEYNYSVLYSEPPINAGVYEVNIEIDENNFSGTATTTLTILKKEVELSLESQIFTYSGTAIIPKFNQTYCVNCSFFENGKEIIEIINAGTYLLNAEVNELNFKGNASFNIEVKAKTVSIALNKTIYEYSGNNVELDYSVTDNAPVSITYINGTSAVANICDVGEYMVIIKTNSKNFTGSLSESIQIVISEENKFNVALQMLAGYKTLTATGIATFSTSLKKVTYNVKKEYCLNQNGYTYFEQYYCSTLGYESFEFFLTSVNNNVEFEQNNSIGNNYSALITGNRETDKTKLGLLPYEILKNATLNENSYVLTLNQNQMLSSYYSYLTGQKCEVTACTLSFVFTNQNKLSFIESYISYTKNGVLITEETILTL